MNHRQFFSASIEHLEAIVDQPDTPMDTLLLVRRELGMRSTARSARLKARVDALLSDIEAGSVNREVSQLSLSIPANLDTKLLLTTLSARARNFLESRAITFAGQLVPLTEAEVFGTPNMGRNSVDELKHLLRTLDLHFGMDVKDWKAPPPPPSPLPEAQPEISTEMLSVRLMSLNLSARARSFVRSRGLHYVGNLAQLTEAELWKSKNVGRRTVKELGDALASVGARFGMALENWKPLPGRHVAPLPAAAAPEPDDLVDALRYYLERIDQSTTAERNIGWTIAHLGWSGDAPLTLEAIGAPVGVTRERVRQIVAKHSRRLRERGLAPRSLERTIEIVRTNLPLTQSRLDSLLIEAGIVQGRFHIRGIEEAANVFGLPLEVAIDSTGDETLILPTALRSLPSAFMREARREIAAYGSVVEDRLQDIAEVLAKRDLDPSFVRTLIDREDTTEELQDAPGWWWRPALAHAGRNRLVNTTAKVLAVSPAISIRDLRDAVRRHVRSNHIAPPSDVMRAIYRRIPTFAMEGDTLARAPGSYDWDAELSDSERVLVEIFKDLGPVLETYQLTDAGVGRGLNEISLGIYKSYSPIIWRVSPRYYALVGQSVPAGTIEALEAAQPSRSPTLIDSGWSARGEMVVCRSVSRGIYTSGLVTIPAASQSFVQGGFDLAALGKRTLGRIEAREATVFGLRHFLRAYGAEEGDTLVLAFDPRTRVCRAWLGSHTLAEAIRDDGIDAVLDDLTAGDDDADEEEA